MRGSSNARNEGGCQWAIHTVAWAVRTFAALIYMHSKLHATQFKHLPDVVMLSPGCHVTMGGAAIRPAWAGTPGGGGGNAAHSMLAEGHYGRCHDGRG